MLPDWSDFPPNWATFNHVRLEKLSLGGKSAQSGNAVDNKPGLHCRGAQSERRRASEICDSEILNAQWKHWKRRTLLTSYYKNHSIHSERGRPLPKIKVIRSNGNVSVVSATWFARYAWLTGSITSNRLYCWPCLLMNNSKSPTWAVHGFTDVVFATQTARRIDLIYK